MMHWTMVSPRLVECFDDLGRGAIKAYLRLAGHCAWAQLTVGKPTVALYAQQLTEILGVQPGTWRGHLKDLEHAELIEVRHVGPRHPYVITVKE